MGMCMPSQGRESLAENPARKNVVTRLAGPIITNIQAHHVKYAISSIL